MTIDEWLAAYDALDQEHEQVVAMKDAASNGEGSYADADSAGFDLDEKYTELAHSAAELLRGIAGVPKADVEESTCRHCQRPIVKDKDGRWVDPEATGDDSVWRETCDENHEDRIAAHEPKASQTLLDNAEAAYDREDQAWFDGLDTDDLAALWAIACDISVGAAWDDEVHDALAKRDYFEKEN